MFSTLYFAAAAALANPSSNDAYAARVLDGRFAEAAALVAARCDAEPGDAAADVRDIHAYADIQLVLGRFEEAEETFRRAQKLLRESRDQTRVMTCRNASWQAFFQNRFGIAQAGFRRIADDRAASVAQKLESLVGACVVMHHLGRAEDAMAALDVLDEAARGADPRWPQLALALRTDLLLQYQIGRADALGDHVYWRSALADLPLSAFAETGAPAAGADAPPLLRMRVDYMRQARALAAGDHAALARIDAHVSWCARTGLADYQRSVRLEVALAALAGCAPNVADTMIAPYRDAAGRCGSHVRWTLDYLYCAAKVREQQGRIRESSSLYARYALASVRHVRLDGAALAPALAIARCGTHAGAPSDDVSARLPGKYRRAYRYLMERLDQRDLSVREIAAHIDVTERALQAAFKTYLGLSPSELIRRQRMERIRGELLSDAPRAASVLEIASRWGIQHRSTLVNGYRRMFDEAPSQTADR
ncbi:helix-turn-helix transcriptional regulator [Burkholderia thailandensis]|uniref:Helix-turn-helix domain protein n=4 Tax=Burkholderia thailandensis TaxID=57975 RepID=A0AAW9CUI2_BURTH|nr:helix-turn-helix transcriptional regulator [Burkholderia thailandensis]ABC34756.1 regulatory protein HrpB [Burkholderia thailandensis E264]AHI67156.1 helix-turn-helix domain protein [Burkholderia thailandensis H0587]AHI75809.1 bacterial regulatory helix-turn-helix s, AraC family protein [Burkholderia thailandensis 2002721723]AHI82333.1 bacterial regulatory helix-turn-helix s, AraC family protein [Burkholderia thailandensis E444]AIC89104.1 bacterial regulatory helix-turn-helix s, AraC family